jgi:hypothetical protein
MLLQQQLRLKLLDASVLLVHVRLYAYKACTKVTPNFISYLLCISIFLPADLQERGSIKDSPAPLRIPALRYSLRPHRPGTQNMRREGHYHINTVHLPLGAQSNFEARSSAKEQRNENETRNGERNSIFFFFSFLSHFCRPPVVISPYLSLCAVRLVNSLLSAVTRHGM